MDIYFVEGRSGKQSDGLRVWMVAAFINEKNAQDHMQNCMRVAGRVFDEMLNNDSDEPVEQHNEFDPRMVIHPVHGIAYCYGILPVLDAGESTINLATETRA